MSFELAAMRDDYGDPLDGARACRRAASLFDFSCVARARVSGAGAVRALQRLITRRLDGLRPGRIAYGLREDATGRLLADVTVWRIDDMTYELFSGRRVDVSDLVRLVERSPDCHAQDLSEATAIFAVQGPRSLAALLRLGAPARLARLAYFQFAPMRLLGASCLVGRLGYTGEPGFEIVAPRDAAAGLWDALAGIVPAAGFAVANILRIEAGFILFANDLRLPVMAREAGLGGFADAPAAMSQAADRGSSADACRLVSFRSPIEGTPALWTPATDLARPIRPGQIVVTSACSSPLCSGTLGGPGTLGLGYVRRADLETTARVQFASDGFGPVELVSHPFYDTAKRRPRAPWATWQQ